MMISIQQGELPVGAARLTGTAGVLQKFIRRTLRTGRARIKQKSSRQTARRPHPALRLSIVPGQNAEAALHYVGRDLRHLGNHESESHSD
jgi:hypothetical protein